MLVIFCKKYPLSAYILDCHIFYAIDNLLVSQNLYSKNYKIDEDWENLINKYLKCRKLNKELADAFVDKVQVFEDGRISVNLIYDDCLEELLQVKNKREGDLYE